jgi:hypothetical protein
MVTGKLHPVHKSGQLHFYPFNPLIPKAEKGRFQR